MLDQIRKELENYIFYIKLFNKYIPKKRRLIKLLEVFTLIVTITCVILKFKHPESSAWWGGIILLFQLLLFFRSYFLVGLDKIAIYDLVQKFYIIQLPKMEKLWRDFYEDRISEKQAQKRLDILKKEEQEMVIQYNHDVPNFSKNVINTAENEVISELKRKFNIKKI